MTDLVPELRTDKNGVSRRYWVRPTSDSVATKSLPAPRGPQAVLPVEGDNEAFIALLSEHTVFHQPPGLNKALNRVRKVCPETLSLGARLLQNGCKQGRSAAAGAFVDGVYDIATNIHPFDNHANDAIEAKAGFGARVSMLSHWHACNVIEAAGLNLSRDEYKSIRTGVWDAHYFGARHGDGTAGNLDELPGDEYWRGSAALQLVRFVSNASEPDYTKDAEFIMWAGAQDDIAAVIKLASERGTDAKTLEAIISQTGIHSSLREGTL